MTKEQLKEEIQKALDEVPESALEDILNSSFASYSGPFKREVTGFKIALFL